MSREILFATGLTTIATAVMKHWFCINIQWLQNTFSRTAEEPETLQTMTSTLDSIHGNHTQQQT